MKTAAAALASFVVLVLVLGVGIYSNAVLPSTTPAAALPAPPASPEPVADSDPAPFTGTSDGCTETDPTNPDGCLTPAMAWLYEQLEQHFGHQPTACWDRHAWNPTSDHPQGRACDVTIGKAGAFLDDADRAHGWEVANWLRANAAALDISYVIWDGQIWSLAHDDEGWRTYTGGGIYDVTTATGGHYDHVHVSTGT